MKFSKYHALGNDYLVIEPKNTNKPLSQKDIKTICDRNFGVGSDGILFGPEADETANFSVKIYNPDGSEAEKSGNGLRIFSRYLWDRTLVSDKTFSIQTKGGKVSAVVAKDGKSVSVEMGKVRFTHGKIGDPQPKPETIKVEDKEFTYYLANVGNPHCVIFVEELSSELAKIYGSIIETLPRFTNRTNVQFVKVLDRGSIQIEIWERGAGYTLASGSSSTAAATVAHALGYCGPEIMVNMPGGTIYIELDKDFHATMTGAVSKISEGEVSAEAIT